MDRKKIAQRISQLEARLQSQEARLRKREQARDIRRKILLGAFILHHVETSGDRKQLERLRDWFRRELPAFLAQNGGNGLFPDLLEQPENAGHGEDQR